MNNIEVEIRSLISKEQYDELVGYFNTNTSLIKKDSQETFYLKSPVDLRIQKNDFYAKIWMKKGRIHDEQREEIEIKFERDDFEKLEKIFSILGYEIEIKWFRERREYEWDGITTCLDYTHGYGYIIELEKMCSEDEKEKGLDELKTKLKSLNIELTSREVFEDKYNYYKENWRNLI